MISYKRDFLERQSLSEVKMGRGSLICERGRKKIVEYFKNNVPHVKLQRLCKYHHLQQGRAETFGGAGAQSIKGAHGTRLLIGLCCLLICVSKWMLLY